MEQVNRIIIVFLASISMSLCVVELASAQDGIDLDYDQKRQSLTAKIRDAPRRAVIEKVKKKTGIRITTWLKDSRSVLNESISAQFKNLSIEDALQRIFAGINHSIVFDESGKSVRLMLLGKQIKKRGYSRRRRRRSNRRRRHRRR